MIALLASFIAALDGLLLTMSRIAMNDIYLLFFVLLAFVLFINKKYFLMSIALGLSIASKWTGFFGIGILAAIYFVQNINLYRGNLKKLLFKALNISAYFIIIPAAIYLFSYLPFFGGKHYAPGLEKSIVVTFINLQQQMYWYHTNLKAHHSYESKPMQWLFDLRPVWFYVDYKDKTISNIYNLGNPIFMWGGFSAIIFVLFELFKKKSSSLIFILIGYFGFFLPWFLSPRIMFYYHYLPAVPFLSIALGYVLNQIVVKSKRGEVFVSIFLCAAALLFVYFLPLWTAVHVPRDLYNTYFWFKSWK
jgi:dolichyl-phosphate-mannose--protein O-mannosyl transferase